MQRVGQTKRSECHIAHKSVASNGAAARVQSAPESARQTCLAQLFLLWAVLNTFGRDSALLG
eukprot:13334223-Alexandrium_andersonii.AAC.1